MGVNRSGYYRWLGRGPNQYEQKRAILTERIYQIHRKHKAYGYHGIASVLRGSIDLSFSDNLIHKCCKYENIKSKAAHYQWHRPGDEHEIYKNQIHGDWNVTGPLQKVTSDMTILRWKGARMEWTLVMDVYNDAIIAWSMSRTAGDPAPYYRTRDSLLRIIKKEGITSPVYFHTDQGAVYASRAYNKALTNHNNIIRSMSRAGTPTDNACMESINGWIKAEIKCDFDIHHYSSPEEFARDYIRYYNYERPSSKLKYKSPARFTIEQGYIPTF